MNRRARRAAARGAKRRRRTAAGRVAHRPITTAALLAGLGAGSMAYGDTFTWDDGALADSNWNTDGNWNNAGAPGAADVAQWSGGGTPSPTTVDLAQSEAAQRLFINGKDVTFNLNSFALTVGGATTQITNEASVATFNGLGTVTFNSNRLEVGTDAIASGGQQTTHARLNIQGGATFNTNAGVVLGDYRTGGIATVSGPGTVWNSAGAFSLGESGGGGRIQDQPRARLIINNGAHFNHDLGAYATALDESFNVGLASSTQTLVEVDGAGSQFNFIGGYGGNIKISNAASGTWNIINGGVFTAANTDVGLSFQNGVGTTTYNIGEGSLMTAGTFAVSGRSASDIDRGPNVVNVAGVFEATDDEALHGIAIGDRGRVSLQGGTISVADDVQVTLIDDGVSGASATLEGNGTIIGGDLYVEGDSILRPGLSTGTITVQDGDLDVESDTAQLQWELSTDDGSHDLLELLASGSTANIAGVLNFTNLGAGVSEFGIIDFLIADIINYNTFAGAVSSGDIALNTDNLDSVMSAAGYTRVFDTPDATGEYRYLIATNVYGDLDALRLETIPEPASLALLGLGGLGLLRRTRHA